MKLEQWHQVRDSILSEKSPVRLDCINPFSALQDWRLAPAQKESAAEALRKGFLTTLRLPDRPSLLNKGVRSFLRTLMKTATGQSSHWHLPEDVFPAYRQIAAEENVRASGFTTWPDIDLDAIAASSGEREIVLLPVPHSPTGRLPTAAEIAHLIKWVEASPHRYIVLDLVYAYQHLDTPDLRKISEHDQVIVLLSTSKTWLQRCLAGIAVLPERLALEAAPFCEIPTPTECATALRCLHEQAELPAFQAKKFRGRWAEIAPKLLSIDPSWSPPACGYLSIIKSPWDDLHQEHNILSVPPQLFGSKKHEWSIISCLYDLHMRA